MPRWQNRLTSSKERKILLGATTYAVLICYVFLPSFLSDFVNISCTFEQGLCGWENVRGSSLDQFDWTLWNGSTPSRKTGPSVDHTHGTSKGESLNSWYCILDVSLVFCKRLLVMNFLRNLVTISEICFIMQLHQ